MAKQRTVDQRTVWDGPTIAQKKLERHTPDEVVDALIAEGYRAEIVNDELRVSKFPIEGGPRQEVLQNPYVSRHTAKQACGALEHHVTTNPMVVAARLG